MAVPLASSSDHHSHSPSSPSALAGGHANAPDAKTRAVRMTWQATASGKAVHGSVASSLLQYLDACRLACPNGSPSSIRVLRVGVLCSPFPFVAVWESWYHSFVWWCGALFGRLVASVTSRADGIRVAVLLSCVPHATARQWAFDKKNSERCATWVVPLEQIYSHGLAGGADEKGKAVGHDTPATADAAVFETLGCDKENQ